MRLFVAVDLPSVVKSEIFNTIARIKADVHGSYPAKDNYHITLKFLGEVDDNTVGSLVELLNDCCNLRSFKVSVCGFGVFPSFKAPRVLFAKVCDPDGYLKMLSYNINMKLKPLGFDMEKREFVPHITVCRIKRLNVDSKRLIYKFCKESDINIDFNVAGFTLYQSILRREGALYKAIASYKFE